MSIQFRLIKRYRDQRDECADALRRCDAAFGIPSMDKALVAALGHDEACDLREQVRKALSKVPTYAERLRRIFLAVQS